MSAEHSWSRRATATQRVARATATDETVVASGLRTIEREREALAALERAMARPELGESFAAATRCIARSRGRVVVTGMGKSGLVARRTVATLASTGTPAFFIHPADASHGDLGMITEDDVVIACSWSGETNELADILSYCKRFSVTLIAATSGRDSTLARAADIVLALPDVVEACPNDMAPTSSCAVQATLGDALAIALIDLRGFSADDFRILHPKGRLGAQLLQVGDLMSVGEQVPRVDADATILAAVLEMTLKRFGATAIVAPDDRLLGSFTDGDLRRSLGSAGLNSDVRSHMHPSPHRIAPDALASEALAILSERKILQLFVCDDDRLVGMLHMHDLLRAGVV